MVELTSMPNWCGFDFSLGQRIILIPPQGKSLYTSCPILLTFYAEEIELLFLTPSRAIIRIPVNRICAMVADTRPVAGAAVSLEDFFGA